MNTFRPRLHRLLLSLAACAACDSPGGPAEPQDETGDEDNLDDDSSETDVAPTSDDPTDPDATSDDPTGPDTTGDPSTGEDPVGVALDDDVFFFVRELSATEDELWVYDVATDESARVIDLAGAELTSIAIGPDRTHIAFASDYESIDYQASQSIWRLDVTEDGFTGLAQLMPAIPRPGGVSSGYSQRVDDLHWSPDGASVWFGHSFSFDIGEPGGGTLARVDAATGDFELFIDYVADCSVNSSPAPSPDGTTLLSIRGVCIDGTHAGLVAFDLPIAAEPEMIVPSEDMVFATPQWVADGSGVAFAARFDHDADGDGMTDLYGDGVLLLDTTTGDQYVVVAPSVDAYIWDFAMSPDATRFAVCVSSEGGRNLLLVDYSGAEPTTRWLTDDGASCFPAW